MKYLLLLSSILVNSVLSAITFSSSTPISGTGTQSNPILAISGPTGRAAAVWIENFPLQVEVAYFDGMAWFPPVLLGPGSFPTVDIDGSGNAIAIWLSTTNSQIITSRFSVSVGAWSAPIQISTAAINSAPQISVNSSGNAVAVWVVNTQLVTATFTASNNTWSLPVTTPFTGVGSPQVALDDSNTGVIIWNDAQFGIEAINFSI